MNPTTVVTPGGEEMVLLSRAEFEKINAALEKAVDAAAHAKTFVALAAGKQETLTAAEVKEALAAATPLAFWRRKRGLTQKALAEAVGISQSYAADIEAGRRTGDPVHFKRFARALKVRMEDLIVDEAKQ